MVKYFAYGHNMAKGELSRMTGGGVDLLFIGYINDTKIIFPHYSSRWGGGTASFAPAYGHRLWGAVYEVPMDRMKKLDACEESAKDGGGTYSRIKVDIVRQDGGAARGIYTYRANAPEGSYYPPSARYMEAIRKGIRQCSIPKEYFTEISNMLAKL